MKLKVRIEYPENLVTRPVLHELGQKTGVVYSIIRADVDVEKKQNNFVEVELRGSRHDLEDAFEYLLAEGVGLIIFGPSPFGFLRIPPRTALKKMEEKNEKK